MNELNVRIKVFESKYMNLILSKNYENNFISARKIGEWVE